MIGGFLLRWLFNTIALYVTISLVPGITVPSTAGLIIAALALGLVNATLRWLVLLLTLPLNIVTLGLFTLVVNALMLYVVQAFTSLRIASFGAAFIGALIIAIVSTILSYLFGR
jgi:putative membrane protein